MSVRCNKKVSDLNSCGERACPVKNFGFFSIGDESRGKCLSRENGVIDLQFWRTFVSIM